MVFYIQSSTFGPILYSFIHSFQVQSSTVIHPNSAVPRCLAQPDFCGIQVRAVANLLRLNGWVEGDGAQVAGERLALGQELRRKRCSVTFGPDLVVQQRFSWAEFRLLRRDRRLSFRLPLQAEVRLGRNRGRGNRFRVKRARIFRCGGRPPIVSHLAPTRTKRTCKN